MKTNAIARSSLQSVRPQVRDLLARSPAWRALPADRRREVARDTVRVAAYLVKDVDFPNFVADLIKGVFNAIVDSSIRQMEAYAALVAAASKSVDQFMHDNITDHTARDALVDEFPDAVCRTGRGAHGLKLHAPAGSASLARLAAAIGLGEPPIDPRRSGEVRRVVAAARRRLARSRQQILATTILMGINRIVVT